MIISKKIVLLQFLAGGGGGGGGSPPVPSGINGPAKQTENETHFKKILKIGNYFIRTFNRL